MRLDQFARQDLSRTGSIQDALYGAFLDPDVRLIRRAGVNTDVDTSTTPEDLWGGSGLYTGFPSTAEPVRITSSSVNDAAAGTGARTVTVTGLDISGNFIQETVTLAGTTPVVTVQSFWRLNRAFVATSNQDNRAFNAGIITIQQNVTTANIFATIDIGVNVARTTAYTIPANVTGLLSYFEAGGLRSSSTFQGTVAVYIRIPGLAPSLGEEVDISQAILAQREIRGGLYLPPLTDIVLRVLNTTANNIAISGAVEMTLIRNS